MYLQTIPVGKLLTNCYLLADDNGDGVFIDPGDHADRLLAIAQEHHIRITAIWLTHGHFDHLMAVQDIQRATHAELYAPAGDETALTDPRSNLLAYVSSNVPYELKADRLLREGDTVQIGSLAFTVWETPGHTPGSVCYVNDDQLILFSGDTLFADGYGRTDLPGGDETVMQQSLARLYQIDTPYHVYPGHGEDFILGEGL
ncbi:MAG: MBL fold metallo-hydrolase [Clostridia bacterium]|nr:MBL fold metallo-hydrolase [Clostridia bacterium]